MTSEMKPFADEETSLAIGATFTVENRLDRVALYGSLDLTRSREGLVHAERLLSILEGTVAELRRNFEHLPARPLPPAGVDDVDNPFA